MPWSKSDLPKNVKGMDLSEHQLDIFVAAANAALKHYGDEGKAIAVGISAAEEKKNDKLPGGLADNKTLQDIADKHNVPLLDIETQFTKGLEVESEHTTDKEIAAEIAKDHLWEIADYYSKLLEVEKQNSLDKKGEIMYIRHCIAGLATYPDETILIQDACLKQMMPTMAGIPIYIDHVDEIDMSEADGYVTECLYNPLDGSYWAKSIIVDTTAVNKISNGYGASNAYLPKRMGEGGLYHGAQYQREVLEAAYTHLAIVANPRYNESMILTPEQYKIYNEALESELKQLTNSLDNKEEKQQMAKEKKLTLAEKFLTFFNAMDEDEKEKENESQEEEKDEKKNEGDEKDKKIADLEEKLNKLMKKNESEEEEKKEDEKENEEEDEKEEKEEKKNSYFNSIEEAHKKGEVEVTRYWSAVKGEKDGYESFTR